MACKRCNNGKIGSEGYFIYCECKEGSDKKDSAYSQNEVEK